MPDSSGDLGVRTRTGQALLSHIRHDLRTPISGIVGYSEMLLEDAARNRIETFVPDIRKIRDSGRQLLEVLQKSLDTAASESRSDVEIEALATEIHMAMRTPITTVVGYCEALLEEAKESDADRSLLRDLEAIRSCAVNLTALIDDVVLYASGQTARQAREVKAPQVSEMVEQVVNSVRPLDAGPAIRDLAGASILIVDDNAVERDLLVRGLERDGCAVTVADNGYLALQLLGTTPVDLILLDMFMPVMSGFQTLEKLKAESSLRFIPVIMLSCWDDMDSVIRCIEIGAEDFLTKPLNLALLRARMRASIEKKRQRDRDVSHLRRLEEEKTEQYGELVGKSPAIQAIQGRIRQEAGAAGPVLILGEVGTGRELAARLIHSLSPRKDRPVLSIDCGLIGQNPWGDKLFGEVSQSETRFSRSQAVCYMDLVDGGSIVLRNLDALPVGVQERLERFLEAPSSSGQNSRNVRVVATCTGSETDLTESGRILPQLQKRFAGHVVTIPPLRDRKRDIPDLATYFMKRHSVRLGKKLSGLDDQALFNLVTWDYRTSNVQELRVAIERATILSDGEIIGPEVIFLASPGVGRSSGWNLLEFPGVRWLVGLPLFPGAVQVAVALFFSVLFIACFLGPADSGRNPATLLTWSIWWPGLVLSFFLAGRAWCAVCPMSAAGSLAQRLVKGDHRIPKWIKNHGTWFVLIGFLVIAWAEDVSDMRHSPRATGLLLLSILSGAVITSLLTPRRTWCRHLCPLGGFAGICSTTALVELRPTLDVCTAKCKGHACYTGGKDGTPGCPMFQHTMFVDSNEQCVICLNCVRNCPNGSPRMNLKPPATELWVRTVWRPESARFLLMLFLVLIVQALVQRWDSAAAGPSSSWREADRLLFLTPLFLLAGGIPVLLVWLAERWLRRYPDDVAAGSWGLCAAWIPLLVAGFGAYQIGFVPVLDTVRVTFTCSWMQRAVHLAVSLLPALRVFILGSGLVLSLVVMWMRSGGGDGPGLVTWGHRQAPWLLAIVTSFCLLTTVMCG